MYDHEEGKEQTAIHYDAAHPLRVDRQAISAFLEEGFELLYINVAPTSQTFMGNEYSNDMLYFI